MDSKGRSLFGRSGSTVNTRISGGGGEVSPLQASGKSSLLAYSIAQSKAYKEGGSSGDRIQSSWAGDDRAPSFGSGTTGRSSSQDGAAESMRLPVVRKKMEDLFVYYAQHGDRLNTSHLKSHKFHKILVDAGLEEGINELAADTGVPKLPR